MTAPNGTESRRVGIVDLGSNTVRLVVYEYVPGRWFRLVDSIRERARLAEGMTADGTLQDAAIERALDAAELFADYANAAELDSVRVIATSAVRDAGNRQSVLNRVEALGLPIEVLSGEEEGGLGVRAVANGLHINEAWVIDLGGGSVQVSLMSNRRWANGAAYPLGVLRLAERHLRETDAVDTAPSRERLGRIEDELAIHLNPVVEKMKQDPRPLIGIGGTVRNLARITQRRKRYPLEILHGYRFRRDDLEDLARALCTMRPSQRTALIGLNPDRADVILPGALLFRWLLRQSDREELVISGQGVREGAFYQHFLDAPYLIDDVRTFSVKNLFYQFRQPDDHTHQVRRLAVELFDGLAELHHLSRRDRQLLEAAATLHDIGMAIGYYRHHRHGAFLVSSSPLNGFNHREQSLIALLIQYHRKGTPRLGAFADLAQDGDEVRLATMTLCLRLAEHLERSRSGRVRGVEVEIDHSRVLLRLLAHHRPSVEIWEAEKNADLFRRVFKRDLAVEHKPIEEVHDAALVTSAH